MNKYNRVTILLVLLILSLTFVSCVNNDQDKSETFQIEDFKPVKPSEISERDYWELAKTFNQLSVEFINAIYSKDNKKIQELTHTGMSIEVEVEEKQNINHVKQQTVVYEDGKYNSIMQFGIENEPYHYFHIFFENIDDEWKICDLQIDA